MNAGIWIALLAGVASCFFAAATTALKTFSRAKLSELLQANGRERQLEPFLERVPDLVLMTGTARSCLNFVVLLAVLHTVEATGYLSRTVEYLAAFFVACVVVAILGVAIPTAWARYHPEKLLVHSIGLLKVCLAVFGPIVRPLHAFDPVVRRLSGADSQDQSTPISDEVLSVVEEHESEGNVDQLQREMIEGVFALANTTAGQIMTPRTDVQALPAESTLEQVKEAALKFGHSRIPVYDGNIDHVIGVLYVKDLIEHLGQSKPFELRPRLRQALMVPKSKPVRELLAEFKARKVHIAVLLDEYGGTAGIVTIEDIIEELFGEIHDEYERTVEKPSIRRIDTDTVEVDARIHIDELNDELGLKIPEDDDYDTLGGFVFSSLGHIPRVGESFECEGVRLIVTDAARTRVNRVRVEKLQTTPVPDQGPST